MSTPNKMLASFSTDGPRIAAIRLVRKVSNKTRRHLTTTWKIVKKRTARTLFMLPGLAQKDPRRRVTRFQERCINVPTLPSEATEPGYYALIRPPERLLRSPTVSLDHYEANRFAEGVAKYQVGWTVEIPEVFVASLSNARVRNPDFLVSSSRGEIFLDSALGRQEVLETNGILDEVLPSKVISRRGSYILLASPWSDRSYYHWLVDALPRLSLLGAVPGGSRLPLIVPSNAHRYHYESLAVAGISAARQAGLSQAVIQVEQLYYPGMLSPTGHSSPHAIAWLRETFAPHMSTDPARRRIYVSRRDTNRRIVNEDDVIALLTQHGFDVVCPGDLSVCEQVRLFSEAHVVVGPHGAGLTNMIFAPEGASLVELFGSNYINGCFWAIASIRRQKHAFVTFDTDTLDYSVCVKRLRAILQKAGIL